MEAKRFITGFLFLLTFNIFAADFVLVTDLDDTLKITNGKSTTSMVFNAFVRQKVFAGMTTLVKELQVKNIEKTYILTASPSLVGYNVRKLVSKNNMKVDVIYMSRISELRKKIKYKLARLESIIANTKGKLILFGDNQSHDADIYLEIKKRHPSRVAKIYIHKVQPTVIPSGAFEYITPVEVAMDLDSILTEDQIDRVSKSVLYNKKFKRVIPKFSYCPVNTWMTYSSDTKEYAQRVENRVISACRNRQG